MRKKNKTLGNSAWIKTSHKREAVAEVNSDGLQTQVFPYAIHGAIFHVSKYNGKFHFLKKRKKKKKLF